MVLEACLFRRRRLAKWCLRLSDVRCRPSILEIERSDRIYCPERVCVDSANVMLLVARIKVMVNVEDEWWRRRC